jgi:LL-diaminopimelate aminotransferase
LTKKGKVKILFLNYPNNPTAASATKEFFKEVVAFAKKHQILVCHDNAYSEIYYNGKRQPSFLEVPGAIDVGCEFHSLSKTFNMTGFRIGFVVGNKTVIDALAQVKTNVDSGVFNAIQMAGITALRHYKEIGDEVRAVYQKRMDLMIPAVRAAGLECEYPQATFYIWAKIPTSTNSENYVLELIQKKGIVITPGSGFGRAGEGYVRFTTCVDESTLKKVAEEIKR